MNLKLTARLASSYFKSSEPILGFFLQSRAFSRGLSTIQKIITPQFLIKPYAVEAWRKANNLYPSCHELCISPCFKAASSSISLCANLICLDHTFFFDTGELHHRRQYGHTPSLTMVSPVTYAAASDRKSSKNSPEGL